MMENNSEDLSDELQEELKANEHDDDFANFMKPEKPSEKEFTESHRLNPHEKSFEEKEAIRGENKKVIIHRIQMWSIILASGLIALVLICWVLHLLFPEKWHWMTSESLSMIQQYAIGAGGGGLLTKMARDILKR